MTYEAAPATTLVATQCACCARALVDAVSVETGVGPVCREKHGYGTAQTSADWTAALAALGSAVSASDIASWGDDAQRAANALVYRVAVEQRGPAVSAYVAAIAALGFATMAERIRERIDPRWYRDAAPESPRHATIRIDMGADGMLALTSPYAPNAVAALRAVPGRRWNGSQNTFPTTSLDAVVWALRVGYPGQSVVMADGTIVVLRAIEPGETPPVAATPKQAITVALVGKALEVVAPYSEASTVSFRAIKGRRWTGRANSFPVGAKYDVRDALAKHFPDAEVTWPEDLFQAHGVKMAERGQHLGNMFGIEIDKAFA